MTTKEAIQAMLDGKKVRRKSWETNFFVHFNGEGFKDENDDVYHEFLEWDDWELYEEPNQTVTIEKWLCKTQFGTYKVIEGDSNYMNTLESFTFEKLLKTYEVTL